jgi:hypothetical protein
VPLMLKLPPLLLRFCGGLRLEHCCIVEKLVFFFFFLVIQKWQGILGECVICIILYSILSTRLKKEKKKKRLLCFLRRL